VQIEFLINTSVAVFEINEVMENIDFMVIYTAEYSGDWSPGTSITAPYKGFVSSSIINLKKKTLALIYAASI